MNSMHAALLKECRGVKELQLPQKYNENFDVSSEGFCRKHSVVWESTCAFTLVDIKATPDRK